MPVLGPSATFLFRRLNMFLREHPDGFPISLAQLGASLGLGASQTTHTPLPRAIDRCVRFGVARRLGHDRIAVRRFVGTLPQHHVARLPPALQTMHADFLRQAAQSVASFDS